MVDPGIRLRGQFNMFPSISCLFLCQRGPKPISKLDVGPWPDLPPFGSATDWEIKTCLMVCLVVSPGGIIRN